jgi:hypothetical protein
MISVVCVVNDQPIFDSNLLASLKEQDTECELIKVDNEQGQFKSIPKALNYGASQAHADYLMFVHQDVSLIGKSWLRSAEHACKNLGEGVFGVASVGGKGQYLGFIVDRGEFWGSPLGAPVATFTLDECLLIVQRHVFDQNKFDEIFRFHSYGADLSLRLKKQGLGVYVLPYPIYHNSATTPILQAGNLETDDYLLYRKHGEDFPNLRKTTGGLFNQRDQKVGLPLVRRLLGDAFAARLLDADARVYAELPLKSSVLDVGVVPREQQWIKRAKQGSYSVGVSPRKPYLLVSKRTKIHDDYVLASPGHLPFRSGAFAVVLLKGLLEYTKKAEGKATLDCASVVAKKVVVLVPNCGSPSDLAYRFYASTWRAEEFNCLGFKTLGLHFRIDIRFSAARLFPPLKPVLARLFPTLFARELLCIKRIA